MSPALATVDTVIKGEDLQVYAKQLMMEGFRIMVPQPQLTVHGRFIPVPWFVYERNGFVGIVEEGLEGWSHQMPVAPTREDGSSIAVVDPKWRLLVGDAVITAQPMNRGLYNGDRVFMNAGVTTSRWGRYLSMERAA